MSEPVFRVLLPDDYDSLLQLWRGCVGLSIRDADSRDGIGRYLERNPGLSFVAEHDSRLAGSIMAGHDGKRGYIQHLAVAEAFRRRGIAGRLIDHSLDALKRLGIEKSHVHVLQSNADGLDYWTRKGWIRRSEIVMFSFINGDNENA
jgi:ribosomal protein S18 acetylase RimI-like enzyme